MSRRTIETNHGFSGQPLLGFLTRIILPISVCMSPCHSLSLSVSLSLPLSPCLSLSLVLSLCLSVSLYLSVSLSLSIPLSHCLSLSLCLCLSVSVSLSLSLSVSVSLCLYLPLHHYYRGLFINCIYPPSFLPCFFFLHSFLSSSVSF